MLQCLRRERFTVLKIKGEKLGESGKGGKAAK